jgi:hypothetical protein
VGGNMNIDSGIVLATLDKSSAQSSSLFLMTNAITATTGAITVTGGSLQVTNVGPALTVGDKFTLFSEPVANGAALTVTGGGATWNNNLAVDGSISVATVVVGQPTLNFTVGGGGNSLQFTWTGSFKLQVQTNSLSTGLSSNWVDYPGGGSSGVTAPINGANRAVFFRLAPAP